MTNEQRSRSSDRTPSPPFNVNSGGGFARFDALRQGHEEASAARDAHMTSLIGGVDKRIHKAEQDAHALRAQRPNIDTSYTGTVKRAIRVWVVKLSLVAGLVLFLAGLVFIIYRVFMR